MKQPAGWLGALLLALLPAWSGAQNSQDRDSIEPGVATSSAAQPAAEPAAAPAPAAAVPKASKAAPKGTAKVPPKTPGAAPAAAATGPATAAPAAQAPAGGTQPAKANDRLELDPTQISGNRELPRVMYVLPWRRPDVGEFAGKPPNSLLDEVLAPVDRDVFRRQNSYYTALQPDTSPAAHKDEK
jgi:hypothetical protein